MTPIFFQLFSSASNDISVQGCETGQYTLHTFPDGETYVRLLSDVSNRPVIVLAYLHEPNPKFLPLIFFAQTLRELGAKNITLITPYLPYMRQDKRFFDGEGVTSRYFAPLISQSFDRLITMDPHLHRYHSLDQIYTIPSQVIPAAPAISAWIQKNVPNPVLIGPDGESEQWVTQIAQAIQAPHLVLQKVRHGDRHVEVTLPSHLPQNLKEASPVFVDDIISTARTMIEGVSVIRNKLGHDPICIGAHAIFADQAYEELMASGVQQVITCNTIPHASNGIDVLPLLTEPAVF